MKIETIKFLIKEQKDLLWVVKLVNLMIFVAFQDLIPLAAVLERLEKGMALSKEAQQFYQWRLQNVDY